MKFELENILGTLRDSVNYRDWDKVENAIEELEVLQEELILDNDYYKDLAEDMFGN